MRTITNQERDDLQLYLGSRIKDQPITVRHKDNLIKRFEDGGVEIFIGHFSESQVAARTNIAMKMRNELISKLIIPRIVNA